MVPPSTQSVPANQRAPAQTPCHAVPGRGQQEKRRKNRNMSLTYTIQLLLFFMDQVSCTRYHVWSPSCDHENIICCAIGDTGRMFRLLLLAVVFLERQCVLHFFVARVCFAARRREKKGRHSSSTFVRRRPK